MTKSTITDERITSVIERLEHFSSNLKWTDVRGAQDLLTAADGLRELQERRKADSEPVAWMSKGGTVLNGMRQSAHDFAHYNIPLYRHAQPARVVPDAATAIRACLSEFPESARDIVEECADIAENACRAAMIQAGNCRENANSSTNNFREISETSTSTAITPAAPDKKLTDDVLDEIIAGAKTSMEQYLALSLKAEREAWRQRQPTDDERIMAIEGGHNCERCGDEGWVAGEMGITRCECSQAGNSPVIPDGYVMVPKEATDEMQSAGASAIRIETTALNKLWTGNAVFRAMLAAATHDIPAINSVQSVVTVPGKWIPVSERMPEDDVSVLTFDGMYKRVHHAMYGHWQCWEPEKITHWMPLPAAPQEVKGE